MSTQDLNIKDILISDSMFSLKRRVFESAVQSCHINSFHSVGILYPVITCKDSKGQIHLVDGQKRVHYAVETGTETISATLLPETTPVTDLLLLILCNKRHDIESSVMNRIQFLCFASSLNAPESWLLQTLCIAFAFKPHRDFLLQCERINDLPAEVKIFCHDKNVSLRQLINFTFHPADLLSQLMSWRKELQLTASLVDEMASNLRDYLRRDNKSLNEFVREPGVTEILESSLSPRDKTERLREYIHVRRFPLLSETNARIVHIVKALALSKDVQVTWDRTLERRGVDFSISISDPEKWNSILEELNSTEVKDAIQRILEEL